MRWQYKQTILPESKDSAYHPIIEALLQDRGLFDEEERRQFLVPDYDRDTHDPFLFSQMERVVERFSKAQVRGEKVGIFGDFDADGVTSSVLMREAMLELGIESEVYIPEKLSEGHGLNTKAVEYFKEKGVHLIVTLDCGMMNHEEIALANSLGMEVIVVDHHHVPEVLPEAYAIINPKLPGETYPFRELCGAGTTYKVVQALFLRLKPEGSEQLKWLLDVVATGTVADVMPLIGENRVLVKYGLIVLSKTRRPGFQAMIETGRLPFGESVPPTARDIGFQIAPRINAASRMAHGMLAHELLMSKSLDSAKPLSVELEKHNTERRKISTATADAVKKLAEEKFLDKKFIFAAHEDYPYGIVGLIAGRIANELRKPACIMTKGETESRGSFRSVPEFNVIEALEQCSDILVKYGGHAAAAGMTIHNDNLDTFYERFNALAEAKLASVDTDPLLVLDMPVMLEHLSPALYRDLLKFAPFGEGNPEPVFGLEKVILDDVRFVGAGEKHLKLRIKGKNGGKVLDAIAFNLGQKHGDLLVGQEIDIAFTLDENTWNGNTTLQLKVIDMRVSG
ncbi:MAG: single-stranded-DNA-specific exonuclease RecJ [Candidatus Moranbacteria bacterium]|nr:single-stranded-DNA-specific exonuclease RecJ [Candidatus Moranbacteria bacterium]